MARKRKRSIFFWMISLPIVAVILLIVGCNVWIVTSTKGRVFDSPEEIDRQSVGLVLGTSKKVAPDTPNQHFVNRITAAADLFHSGKVGRLLVSGYRDSQYYDETKDMIAKLIELGVPQKKIMADDRGSRTLHSVMRASTVYKLDRLVIISDDFHVGRALFIADHLGMEAVALRSEAVDRNESRGVRWREYFARVKAVLDLYLLPPEREARRELAGRA